jgi:hypothetical protein
VIVRLQSNAGVKRHYRAVLHHVTDKEAVVMCQPPRKVIRLLLEEHSAVVRDPAKRVSSVHTVVATSWTLTGGDRLHAV